MRLRFSIDNTTYSLPVLREGFSLEKRVGALGRHASSSSAFDIQACDETNLILSHEGNLDAQLIEDNGAVIQTGIVRPYLSAGYRGTYRENVSMELIDYSEKLREYVWPEPDDKDDKKPGRVYPMSWKNVSLSTVVGWILHQCGMNRFGSVPSYTIPIINISEGQYLKDVLEDILFGYGLDYRFSATGIPEIFSTFAPDEITDEITDIIGDVSVERNDDTSDGVEITYATAKHIDKATIFSSSLHEQPFGQMFYEEGGWYNGERHSYETDTIITEWTKYDYPYKSTTGYEWLKSVKDGGDKVSKDDIYEVYVGRSGDEVDNEYYKAWMKDEKGITLNPRLSWYDLSGGCFWVDYKGWFQSLFKGWTFNVELYGDVTYRKESLSSYKAEGPRPEKVYLEYVVLEESDTSYARDFAEKYYYRQKNGKISVQFLSSIPLDPGKFYRLGGSFPAVAGFNMGVRVLVVTKGEDGLYTISAEGCSGIEVTQAVERHEVFDARPLSFTGIATGGYDDEGDNEAGTMGAYISPDGEAKFNSIKIEGDDSEFVSDVLRTVRPSQDIPTLSVEVTRPYAPQSAYDWISSLTVNHIYKVLEGTVTRRGIEYDCAGAWAVPLYNYDTEGLAGRSLAFYSKPEVNKAYSIVTFSLRENLLVISGADFSVSNLKLSSDIEGVHVKHLLPFDSDITYSIGGEARPFDIHGRNVHYDRLFNKEGLEITRGITYVGQWKDSSGQVGFDVDFDNGASIQCGKISGISSSTTVSIYEMKDTNYMVFLTYGNSSSISTSLVVSNKTKTSFKVYGAGSMTGGTDLYYMVLGDKA